MFEINMRDVILSKLFSSLILVFSIILLDQITKSLALRFLPTACNTGFAFGIYQGIFNGLIAALVLLVVIWALFKEQKKLVYFSLALVIGGGASNILDRLIRGCVIDFIDLKIWPAFNLADAAITVGVGILIFSLLKLPKKR